MVLRIVLSLFAILSTAWVGVVLVYTRLYLSGSFYSISEPTIFVQRARQQAWEDWVYGGYPFIILGVLLAWIAIYIAKKFDRMISEEKGITYTSRRRVEIRLALIPTFYAPFVLNHIFLE